MNKSWYRNTLQFLCFMIFVASLISIFSVAESRDNDTEISFEWAFVARSQKDGHSEIQPITKDTDLKSGDQLKIMLDVKNDCYVYILHNDSKNQLMQLFPGENTIHDRSVRAGVSYIPGGDSWYKLGEADGVERFYLIASNKRLDELERLLDKYANARNENKPDIITEIKLFIKESRKQHKPLSSPAEQPLTIGGTFRTVGFKNKSPDDKNIKQFAESIYGGTFFARTFTITYD